MKKLILIILVISTSFSSYSQTFMQSWLVSSYQEILDFVKEKSDVEGINSSMYQKSENEIIFTWGPKYGECRYTVMTKCKFVNDMLFAVEEEWRVARGSSCKIYNFLDSYNDDLQQKFWNQHNMKYLIEDCQTGKLNVQYTNFKDYNYETRKYQKMTDKFGNDWKSLSHTAGIWTYTRPFLDDFFNEIQLIYYYGSERCGKQNDKRFIIKTQIYESLPSYDLPSPN